jgi:TolA-binding protein
MVDGRDIRLAHLGWENGELVIHALESVMLQHRLGRIRTVKSPVTAGAEPDSRDVFGLDNQVMSTDGDNEDETAEGDVSSTLINVFSKYPLQQIHLAINTPEGQTTYYNFENAFNLKGKKLLERLRNEIGPLAGGSVEGSLLDFFKGPDGQLTAVVFEGSVPLMDELLEVKSFLPGGAPYFGLVQANELALVNLARVALDLEEGQLSALVYIGADFSRVIILKGEHPLSFVQTIREGYASPQVCQTLFSKILLEQEEAGLPEIDRILLAGEVGLTHAHEYFSRQFPDAKVQSFTPGPLNVGALKPEELAVFPNYTVPVALAWQALEEKNPHFITADLVPPAIKEQQKFFKIAWHGFALLGFVFGCMALLSYQGLMRRGEIKNLRESIRLKQEYIEVLQPELVVLAQIQNQSNNYRANLDFLDSLIVDPGKWSRLFSKLTQDFHAVNDIWIEDIKSDPQGFTMVGKALSRDRVPILAFGFEGASLKRVTRVKTDDGELTYEFEMTANVPAPVITHNVDEALASADHAAVESEKPIAAPPATVPAPTPPTTQIQSEPITTQPDAKPIPVQEKVEEPQPQPPPENLVALPPEMQNPTVSTQKPAETPPSQPEKPKTAAVKSADKIDKSAAESAKTRPQLSEAYNRGIRMVRAGDVSGAINSFEAVITHDPQGSEAAPAHYWIGECHFATGEYGKAVEAFQACLAFPANSKREAALLMSGLTHIKLKQNELAQAQFEQLLEEFPDGDYEQLARNYMRNLSQTR